MGNNLHSYYIGQNSHKKLFKPWYRPGSPGRLRQENSNKTDDDLFINEGNPDQYGLVLNPNEISANAKLAVRGNKANHLLALAKMFVCHHQAYPASGENVMNAVAVLPSYQIGEAKAQEVKWRSNTGNRYSLFIENKPIETEKPNYASPSWYHGFTRGTNSYIKLMKKREGNDTRCQLFLPFASDKIFVIDNVKFNACTDDIALEEAVIWLYKDDKDRFDFGDGNIVIEGLSELMLAVRHEGRKIDLRKATIKLNGEKILNEEYASNHIRSYDFTEDIKKHKIGTIPGASTNSILKVAAQELGNSWLPKYGAPFVLDEDGHPGWWCSEFVRYVIKKTYGWNMGVCETEKISTTLLAQFFMGLDESSTLYRQNKYISPNMANCGWNGLGTKVNAGFYSRVFRGEHSTLFVKWENGFKASRTRNTYFGLGGAQGGKVCINEYDISKETDDDDAIWWTDDDGHLKYYRDATYDGFGNTIQKPFGIHHV